MKTMRKCNDEIYQLAQDQALVKKLKSNKTFRPFCLCPLDVMRVYKHDEACRSSEISSVHIYLNNIKYIKFKIMIFTSR
jgi:hypothetical protein